MAWIESHTVLIRHPKVRHLARLLRIKPVYALGHLHALWHATLEISDDGDLSKYSEEDIADFAAYSGDGPQFVQQLQESGWLDERLLHDWLDYAGRYLDTKYKSRRTDKLVEIYAKHGRSYLGAIQHQSREEAASPTLPNLTKPNQPKDGRARPPSVEAVVGYMGEIGIPNPEREANKFWDYFSSVGWVVGKKRTPMKDWMACCRTWKHNLVERGVKPEGVSPMKAFQLQQQAKQKQAELKHE